MRLLTAALIMAGLTGVSKAQATTGSERERVLGIGGVFFRSRDPETLAEWYEKHLGVAKTPKSYDETPWAQQAGPTVFAPFPANTDYFGKADRQWMLNFRVRDLDAMVRQLRDAGIKVDVDPKEYPNGRFARLHDPEGNPIELWQEASAKRR
jgi:glyoxylase I family protein